MNDLLYGDRVTTRRRMTAEKDIERQRELLAVGTLIAVVILITAVFYLHLDGYSRYQTDYQTTH